MVAFLPRNRVALRTRQIIVDRRVNFLGACEFDVFVALTERQSPAAPWLSYILAVPLTLELVLTSETITWRVGLKVDNVGVERADSPSETSRRLGIVGLATGNPIKEQRMLYIILPYSFLTLFCLVGVVVSIGRVLTADNSE